MNDRTAFIMSELPQVVFDGAPPPFKAVSNGILKDFRTLAHLLSSTVL